LLKVNFTIRKSKVASKFRLGQNKLCFAIFAKNEKQWQTAAWQDL
jgi:hypothetical protein